MPPYCALCRKNHRVNPDEDFNLIRFKLTEDERMEKDKIDAALSRGKPIVGHPPGAYWFCSEHASKVKSLTHLTWPEVKNLFNSVE